MRKPVVPSLGALLVVVLAACGAERHIAEPTWRASKIQPHVGRVEAAVVARPAPDRAVVEARFENRSGRDACDLEIVLPEGVILRTGRSVRPVGPDETTGSASWEVEFPTGRPLDAVIRLCAQTQEGTRAAEVAVRLTPGDR